MVILWGLLVWATPFQIAEAIGFFVDAKQTKQPKKDSYF